MSKYKINSSMNFSVGSDEFYLTAGETAELPDHELVDSLAIKGHVTKVEAEKPAEIKKTSTEKK